MEMPQDGETGLFVSLTIEVEQEVDGRWLAEILKLRGVMVYGSTREEAIAGVQALSIRVIADKLEHREPVFQSEVQI